MSKFPTFAEFFTAVHGCEPYVWQNTVAQDILCGQFPEQVSVPTGMGKTSMIDISLYCLAHAIHHNSTDRVGQRIFLAVERQVIVDGISEHVKRLVAAVNDPCTPETQAVHDALITISADNIAVKQESFHGSKRSTGEWLDAVGATIVTTTVTQVLLRLLGRAPGVSRGVAPVHAGLLGVDSVILIDEPHLVIPQVSSIKQILGFQEGTSHVCVIGATVRDGVVDDEKIFRFNPETESSSAVDKLHAPKNVVVETVESNFPDYAVKTLMPYLVRSGTFKLGVIVNDIQTAKSTYTKVKKVAEKHGYRVRILTSHVRPAQRPAPDEIGTAGEVLIATQVVEAGADFSLDVLVSELAPLPSMLQRLGRVNRDASSTEAVCYIKSAITKSSESIYGTEPLSLLKETFETLIDGQAGPLDFSLVEQPALISRICNLVGDDGKGLWPATPTPAVLSKKVVSEYLGSTSSPHGDPSGILKGIERDDRARVSIAWRSPVPLSGSTVEGLRASVSVARPLAPECISLSLDKAWDVVSKREYIVVGSENKKLTPGCTVVVSAESGGLDDTGVNKNSADPVSDLSASVLLSETSGRKARYAPLAAASLAYAAGKPVDSLSSTVRDLYDQLRQGSSAVSVRKATKTFLDTVLGYAVQVTISQDGIISYRRDVDVRESEYARPLSLEDHLLLVGRIAGEYADKAGVAVDKGNLVQAAYAHDLGKSHPSFQMLLGKRSDDPILAKSSGRTPLFAPEDISGYMHELPAARVFDGLVSWLIASHHGRTRGSYKSRTETTEFVDLKNRLESEMGIFTLLHLEALLRCADWRGSAFPEYNLPPHDTVTKNLSLNIPFENVHGEVSKVETHFPTVHLPSWYAVYGLVSYLHHRGEDVRVRWLGAHAEIGSATLSPIELRRKINTAVCEIFNLLNSDKESAGVILREFSTSKLTAKDQKIAVRDARDIARVWQCLQDSDNVFASLFSPWVDNLSTSGGKKVWRMVTPFLAKNSNVFKVLDLIAEDEIKAEVEGCVNFSKPELDILALNSASFYSPVTTILGLYGGLVATHMSQSGFGSCGKDRLVPVPQTWVTLEQLEGLTNGITVKNIGNCPMIMGKNNGEKAQKILDASLVQ